MEGKFHGLPTLKGFRLKQQGEDKHQEHEDDGVTSERLPVKTRKEFRDQPPVSLNSTITTTYCMPAKKRVWAPSKSNLITGEPISHFNLIVEYIFFLSSTSPSSDEDGGFKIKEQREKEAEKVREEKEDGDDLNVCAICQSTDLPSDPIVFCDGCENTLRRVSQNWIVRGGAMKPTNDGQGAHIVCALLVPEVFSVTRKT
ncbi:unnamed protein product [Ilex paraguariensis]|uniref:Uncharacterized protein n=1 Tax=Ilex paraguariensis TaxID=185542 RepID=A0ABC8S4G6_9AQUA